MNEWFTIRESPIQGKGAFALKDIPSGTRIIEYTGERISDEEAGNRYDDEAMERHHTFLFDIEDGEIIDGAVGGSEAIYINHSCEPNCEPVIEDKHVWIDAIRDIKAGEELFYDYGYARDEDDDGSDDDMYACKCGSPKCRGTILAPREEVTGADDAGAEELVEIDDEDFAEHEDELDEALEAEDTLRENDDETR
jgi:SET domain-containing protein